LHMLPRVVHPADVQTQDMYVNGRDWHYVCGVIATEVIKPPGETGRATSMNDGFQLKMLDRKLSIMYPEERLGGFINSASAQWQVIDALFQGMRDVMSSGTAYTSGSFSIAWTNSCQKLWEVTFLSHYAPPTPNPPPPPPHPVPLESVLSGVDENSKAARVDENNNDDRTPHAHSKLHNAEESCRGVLLSLSFSSTRAALLFSSIPYVWHTLRRQCRGASKIM
jgi:hypothetical protein